MRSTSTADRLRWQPPHEPPTMRAMAMPPDWGRNVSYSASSSDSTPPAMTSALGAHPLELGLDLDLLLGDLRPERRGALVELGPAARRPQQVGVERLDLLHQLELLVLELGDPPLERPDLVLQRLQLAGVADRPAVQRLVVLGRPVGQRRDLVLQLLLGPSELVALRLDLGDRDLERAELAHRRVEVGPARQVSPPVHQLVDGRVVLLDGEEGVPATHARPSWHVTATSSAGRSWSGATWSSEGRPGSWWSCPPPAGSWSSS